VHLAEIEDAGEEGGLTPHTPLQVPHETQLVNTIGGQVERVARWPQVERRRDGCKRSDLFRSGAIAAVFTGKLHHDVAAHGVAGADDLLQPTLRDEVLDYRVHVAGEAGVVQRAG